MSKSPFELAGARVGFTGTQRTPTSRQKSALRTLLQALAPRELHHGDCVGSDAYAHELASHYRVRVVIHPPDVDAKRAFCSGKNAVILPAKPYLVRNRDVVDSTSFLVATPGELEEKLRSGTWATIRYAKKIGRAVVTVWPDGSVSHAPSTKKRTLFHI